MTEPYHLEKPLWTDADFEVMGWHDSRVWAMAADEERFEFAMDLDYIFEWVHPGPGETYFRFWVAPVTMVFENAYDVTFDIESQQGVIEVADLHREEPKPTPNGALTDHLFRFECQEGEISLRATGYRMYVRSEPRLMHGQCFSLEERGGISVERRTLSV
ncbi:MAG: hypothetical protein ABS41_03875 [Arenimonas sp. SCN 70-307]|uniref:hypothetical protein n=1 Tax=Arenimonas sp. SCN 70-307 TaxID=1660089 RepID=UPI00086932E2|nr:hypothetical protein [Arenimonas sp. SCN 70-307]ODS63960.1 MAG: hypothetical protein ABS41_03875 [Arenimonas sp. SCN 70-307]